MAVTVTFKDGSDDEVFVDANDEYFEKADGILAVRRSSDGTVKTFAANSWATVDGKKKRRGVIW